MKNIEKYGKQIIDYAKYDGNFCLQVRRWRMNDPQAECPNTKARLEDVRAIQAICEICEADNAAWLLKDAVELDWESLEAGTVLRYKNLYYEGETAEYEFVHYCKGDVWLRRLWDDGSCYNIIENAEALKTRLPGLGVVRE